MTVFVVQNQMIMNDNGDVVPRFSSIKKAERFGEIEYLLGPNADPFASNQVIGALHEKLKVFTKNDYLLLIGNPVLIGLATAIAAHYTGGTVQFLQWSSRVKDYATIGLRMF